jgi:hypothetical protein
MTNQNTAGHTKTTKVAPELALFARKEYRLTRALSELLLLLVSQQIVTTHTIEHTHRIATDGKVAVHRLRRRLAPYGLKVESQRDVGYWMDDAHKEAVLTALGMSLQAA